MNMRCERACTLCVLQAGSNRISIWESPDEAISIFSSLFDVFFGFNLCVKKFKATIWLPRF
jgi:hypothetical protein